MKKKLVIFILILSVVLSAFVFSGCENIIKKNDERVQQQILATVSYKGDSSTVTYGQLLESYTSYGYYYVNYYSYTIEQTLELLLNQLANRELLVLYAKERIVEAKGLSGSPQDYDYEQLLTKAEIDKAIRETNKEMESALESIIKSLKEEEEANKGSGINYDGQKHKITFVSGSEEAEGKAPDKIEAESGSSISLPQNTFELEGKKFKGWSDGETTYKAGDSFLVSNADIELTAVWGPDLPEPRPVRAEVEKKDEDEDKDYNADDDTVALSPKLILNGAKNPAYVNEKLTSDAYFTKAMDQLLKNLKSGYKGYEYFFRAQLKTVVIARLEKIIKSEMPAPTDADVLAEYNRIIAENKESFKLSASAYDTALQSKLDKTIYHNSTEPYAFVRNMLLKFTDEEYAELNRIYKNGTVGEEQIKAYALAIAREKMIYISNPDFTTEAYEKEDEHVIEGSVCSVCGELDATDYNNLITYDAETDEIVYNCGGCAAKPYLELKWPAYDKAASGDEPAKTGIVTQIKNSFDAVNSDDSLSEFEKVLKLQELSISWTYLVCDDTGSFAGSDSYNALGYLITPEGTTSNFLEDFTEQGRALAKQGPGSYVNDDTGEFEIITYSFTSGYAGIFMLLTTNVPYDTAKIDAVTSADGYEGLSAQELKEQQILPLDYVVSYGANTEESKTIREIIYDSLKTTRENDYYNLQTSQFVKSNRDSAISKDTKLWAKLMKEINEG
jgi:hypothetical protein